MMGVVCREAVAGDAPILYDALGPRSSYRSANILNWTMVWPWIIGRHGPTSQEFRSSVQLKILFYMQMGLLQCHSGF